MGALTALQLDLIIATGERLLHPVGQSVLIRAVATAGVAGFLCWTVCALVTRAISRAAVKPYYALADHFERLADGDAGLAFDPREPEPGARRLVRAIAVFHHRAEASQRAEAALQLRYDRLHHNHAAERRLSAGLLIDPAAHRRYLGRVAPAAVDGSEPSVAAPEVGGGPTAGRYDSLYDDPRERRLLLNMLTSKPLGSKGPPGLQPPFGVTLAEFTMPRRAPSASPEAAEGGSSHGGWMIDPTGRLRYSARSIVHDLSQGTVHSLDADLAPLAGAPRPADPADADLSRRSPGTSG